MSVVTPALERFAAEHPFAVHLDREGPPPDDPLLQLYGGPLRVRSDAPRLIANFVSSVDGVTAFGPGRGEGAGAVSLHSAADRFVMALLRCAADCVLIGAGTLRDDAHHQWTPRTVMPGLAAELAVHRRRLTGSDLPPPLVVISAGGALPDGHPALAAPETEVVVITGKAGAARLPTLHPSVRVALVPQGGAGEISPGTILDTVRRELGALTVLCEGGPRLFSQLLAGGRVDELFLTLAPHLAGSADRDRPGLVSGAAFAPGSTPRLDLRSLRQEGDHLFLRYAVVPGG